MSVCVRAHACACVLRAQSRCLLLCCVCCGPCSRCCSIVPLSAAVRALFLSSSSLLCPRGCRCASDSSYFYPYHRVFGRLARHPIIKKLWATCKAPKNLRIGI